MGSDYHLSPPGPSAMERAEQAYMRARREWYLEYAGFSEKRYIAELEREVKLQWRNDIDAVNEKKRVRDAESAWERAKADVAQKDAALQALSKKKAGE